MVGKSHQNVSLIRKDSSSFAEFEISEFEISRFDSNLLFVLYFFRNEDNHDYQGMDQLNCSEAKSCDAEVYYEEI